MADPYAGRRYSDRTGKGLYEDQAEGLSSGLRQLFGGGVSPRKSEGAVAPLETAPLAPSTTQPPTGSRSVASQGDLRRFDTGGDAQRPGLAAGYTATQTRVPGVMRVDGGRSPLFTNIDPVEAVEGLRGGTVSNIGDASEGLARMARANAIRQGQLGGGGGRGYDPDSQVTIVRDEDGERKRAQWESDIDKFSMVGNTGGRAGRAQRALDLQEYGLRQRAEEARMRNALDERALNENVADRRDRMGLDRDRMGLDRERFEFEKAPKPMGALDQVRLAEAQYGLSKARADAAAAAADRAGVSQEDRTRLFQNFGGDGGLTDLSPDRMDGEIARQAIGLRANDLANQHSIGGATSSKMFTPIKEDKYNWGDMRFWDDDPNTPNAWQTLTSSAGDVVVGDDGRRVNAAGLRKATKDIDLLGRLTKPRN